jgi:hypothetical protein
MKDDLIEIVKLAIGESRKARDVFTEVMHEISEEQGYTDAKDRDPHEKQTFGAPAPEESILQLEAAINMKLPPSYRAFLQLNDGWKVIDGSQIFFSISELLAWRKRTDPSNWISIAKVSGNNFVEDCLVIGASDDAPDKYLLNPKVVIEGEWQFSDYGKDGCVSFDSFLSFLLDTKQQFLDASKELEFGEYFDPFAEE